MTGRRKNARKHRAGTGFACGSRHHDGRYAAVVAEREQSLKEDISHIAISGRPQFRVQVHGGVHFANAAADLPPGLRDIGTDEVHACDFQTDSLGGANG